MYIAGSTSSNRVTGMVSGLDVDELVASAMEAEMYEYNKVYRDQQLAQWKMEAYQEVTMQLAGFEDTYFNFLNSDSNMLSSSTYSVMQAVSTSSAVSVSAGENANVAAHSVNVNQLATSASYSSGSNISKDVQGSSIPDYSAMDGTLNLNVDGTEKEIDLSSVASVSDLQSEIDASIGSGKIEVTENADGYLVLSVVGGSGVTQIDISETGESTLTALGFETGSVLTNRLDSELTLEEINDSLVNAFAFDSSGGVSLTINGVDFSFTEETTLNEMMTEINSSDASVTMSYLSSTGEFVIEADQTGLGETIQISESGSTFLSSLDLVYQEGQDAVVEIDGSTLVRSENTFVLDDVTYTLNDVTDEAIEVDVSKDPEAAYKAINEFINAYNELIESLEALIGEEYNRDYPPLTESQKAEMSEEEIENWESAAKTGILEDDPYIEDLLDDMRYALFQPVEGVDLTLYDIGITTGSYSDKGQLNIDEDKLLEALENDSEAVMSLFSQSSSSYPGTTTARDLTSDEMSVRYNEQGLVYRLYDAVENKASIYRDSAGNKGALLELAGKEADPSEKDNTLYYEIEKYSEELLTLEEWLIEKEEEYYEDYTVMETALSNMNAELEALYSMLGD